MASEEELEKLLDKIMVIFRYKNIHKFASRVGLNLPKFPSN